jgi:hypothetical protein
MAKKKKVSPLTKALLETADDMQKAGLMDKATHEKITRRHLGATGAAKPLRLRGRKSGPCATGSIEPGGVRPLSQSDPGLRLAAGARYETADPRGFRFWDNMASVSAPG